MKHEVKAEDVLAEVHQIDPRVVALAQERVVRRKMEVDLRQMVDEVGRLQAREERCECEDREVSTEAEGGSGSTRGPLGDRLASRNLARATGMGDR